MKGEVTVWEWMDLTCPIGWGREENIVRKAEREKVLSEARTSIGTLRVARTRGRIGAGLLSRMVLATKGSRFPIADLAEKDPKITLRELVEVIQNNPPPGFSEKDVDRLARKALGRKA